MYFIVRRIMKKILKLSFDEWKKMFHNRITTSCGVTFKDGFKGSYCLERYKSIEVDIENLIKEHGDVDYIACAK